MEDGNETKWEKKWLPDGQHYVYVHRITGEQTEPIVPDCTCRCETEQIETKFTPFYHENIGIKEEICSMDEEEELEKDTTSSDTKDLWNSNECTCRCIKTEQIETKFTPFYHENIGIKEEICSMDEEEELEKDTTSSDTKDLWNSNECTCRCFKTEQIESKFTPFYHENIGIKEEICSMDEEEELEKDTTSSDTKDRWKSNECTCRCKTEQIETKFTPFYHENIGIKEEICSMDEEGELEKDTTSSDTKDLAMRNSNEESDLQGALTEGLDKRNDKNMKKSSYQSKVEKVKTSYMCKKCKKEMESLKLLKKHSCADNDFDYICCTCERVFKTKYEMIKHLEGHGISETKLTDKQHNRERMNNEPTDETKSKRFKCICLTCEKIFTSFYYAMSEHMKIHSGDKPYVCDLCGSAFCSASYLAKHSKIHSGNKPYQCKICGKAFSTNSNYRHHLGSHLESRPYNCSQCDMAFKSKAHLNQHILYKHSPFSFTCGKCSKTFAREADLKRHSIVHGDRVESYQCEECGKTFRWPANFKMHRQTHDKLRPTFPCTVCDKVLLSERSLKRHMVLHADESTLS